MPTDALRSAVQAALAAIRPPSASTSDAELLSAFAATRDEAAFAELVRRHSRLVHGAARRIVADPAVADDVSQATFLLLAKKAAAVRWTANVGPWLYQVASRLAIKARSRAARRARPTVALPDVPAPHTDPAAALTWAEVRAVLDEGLARLPASLRDPLVLCHLEGLTRDEAAAALGCSPIVLKGRLERGRERLRKDLEGRGLSLTAALSGVLVAEPLLAREAATVIARAAAEFVRGGAVAPAVGELLRGALGLSVWKPMVGLAAGLLVACAVGAVQTSSSPTAPTAPAADPPKAAAAPPKHTVEQPADKADRYGDALPDGAVARLGTMRWRHSGEVSSMTFSPNGKLLASACNDGILIWEVSSGKILRRLSSTTQIQWPTFTPDGKTLITIAGGNDIAFWETASGKQLRTLPIPFVNGPEISLRLSLSPDGKVIAVTSSSDRIALMDAVSGKVLYHLGGHKAAVYGLAFSPDGKTLAMGTLNPSVQLWNVVTGQLVHGLDNGNNRFVGTVAFSPDGKIIASGSWDLIVLSDTATGKEVGRLEAKGMQPLNGLAFTPDGKTLVSGSQDGKVRIWDLATKKERLTLDGRMGIGRSMSLSPDGKTVAFGAAYDAIRLWDISTGKELFTEFEGHDAPVNCVAFTPDGKTLVTGDSLEARFWDASDWKQSDVLKGSSRGISFMPDGKRMLIVNRKQVRIRDIAKRQDAIKVESPDVDQFRRALLTRDGKNLVTTDWKRGGTYGTTRLILWDTADGKQLRQMKVPEMNGESLALINSRLAITNNVKRIQVYDLEEGKEVLTLMGHKHHVESLALSADNKTLLSGGLDREVHLWDLVSGQEIAFLEGHKRAVAAVALSPNGRLAASAGGSSRYPYEVTEPRRIRLWDVFSGKEVAHFEGHTADVNSLAFSPDGKRLVSGHRDSTVLVWDMTGLPPLPSLKANAKEVDGLWNHLADPDARKAHQAIWKLAATPDHALPFLKKHISPVTAVDAKQLNRLIADLESNEFAVRNAAVKELRILGDLALPALREVLKKNPSAEVRRHVEALLADTWVVRSPEVLRQLRTVQVLERMGTPEARTLLRELAGGAPEARLTKDAAAASARLAKRP